MIDAFALCYIRSEVGVSFFGKEGGLFLPGLPVVRNRTYWVLDCKYNFFGKINEMLYIII